MKHPGDAVFEPSSQEQNELAAECEQRRRMVYALHVAQAMIDPENHPPQFSTGEALKIINAAIAKAAP